jgi:hypothetical protein
VPRLPLAAGAQHCRDAARRRRAHPALITSQGQDREAPLCTYSIYEK